MPAEKPGCDQQVGQERTHTYPCVSKRHFVTGKRPHTTPRPPGDAICDSARPEICLGSRCTGAYGLLRGHACLTSLNFSSAEVAKRLGMSRTTVLRRIADGDLKATKVGTHHRIPLGEFERYSHELVRRMAEASAADIEAELSHADGRSGWSIVSP